MRFCPRDWTALYYDCFVTQWKCQGGCPGPLRPGPTHQVREDRLQKRRTRRAESVPPQGVAHFGADQATYRAGRGDPARPRYDTGIWEWPALRCCQEPCPFCIGGPNLGSCMKMKGEVWEGEHCLHMCHKCRLGWDKGNVYHLSFKAGRKDGVDFHYPVIMKLVYFCSIGLVKTDLGQRQAQ